MMNKELALLDYVNDKFAQPFEFGINDCPLFVAGGIDAMFGTDLYQQYKGKWRDKKSAWKYAKKHGEIQDHLRNLGFELIGEKFMALGDVVIMEQALAHEKGWKSAAICLGATTAVMTLNGLVIVDNAGLENAVEVLRWQA